MGKTTKIWLVIAIFLVIIGCIIFGGAMTVTKWDFKKLSTVKYESNEYEINEIFRNISIETDAADIKLTLAADGKCRVECYEEQKAKHSVTVEDDTLTIKVLDEKAWYDHIGIHIGTPKLTIYLPKAEYAALYIKESTGKIHVQNISAGELDFTTTTGEVQLANVICEGNINIDVSTGKVNLTDIQCKNLTSKGSTGNIIMTNVVATEKFSIKRSTGNVNFEDSDANEILVDTSTGNVKGTLLTDKVFITHTDTGRVNVPKSVTGGKCEISSDTGNIKIEVIS